MLRHHQRRRLLVQSTVTTTYIVGAYPFLRHSARDIPNTAGSLLRLLHSNSNPIVATLYYNCWCNSKWYLEASTFLWPLQMRTFLTIDVKCQTYLSSFEALHGRQITGIGSQRIFSRRCTADDFHQQVPTGIMQRHTANKKAKAKHSLRSLLRQCRLRSETWLQVDGNFYVAIKISGSAHYELTVALLEGSICCPQRSIDDLICGVPLRRTKLQTPVNNCKNTNLTNKT